MPSTMVRMKPPGLFGPGEIIRARIPATAPTIKIYNMAVVLFAKKQALERWAFYGTPAMACRIA
jgi:hypothetical protein